MMQTFSLYGFPFFTDRDGSGHKMCLFLTKGTILMTEQWLGKETNNRRETRGGRPVVAGKRTAETRW
jgi:hypothetical protein